MWRRNRTGGIIRKKEAGLSSRGRAVGQNNVESATLSKRYTH